jgi:hypothetical protein
MIPTFWAHDTFTDLDKCVRIHRQISGDPGIGTFWASNPELIAVPSWIGFAHRGTGIARPQQQTQAIRTEN